MQLYFTRHGKTEWNLARRFPGMMKNTPLLTESYQEIQHLGDAIANVQHEKIYSSSFAATLGVFSRPLAQANDESSHWEVRRLIHPFGCPTCRSCQQDRTFLPCILRDLNQDHSIQQIIERFH